MKKISRADIIDELGYRTFQKVWEDKISNVSNDAKHIILRDLSIAPLRNIVHIIEEDIDESS